jgi:hypothetical protein
MNLSMLIKVGLAIVCPLLWLLVIAYPPRWLGGWARRAISSLVFFGTRLGSLIVWIAFPRLIGTPDLTIYYLPQARDVLHGLIPNVDFPSSYSPGFTYVTAALLGVIDHPATLVLLMLAAELLGLRLLWKAFRLERLDEEARIRILGTYALHPLCLWYVGVAAYQASLVMMFWAIGLATFRRTGWSSLVYGFGLLMTKLLAILAWPAVVLRRDGFWKGVFGIGVAVAFLGLLYRFGLDFIRPWLKEGSDVSNGNILFLLGSIFSTPLNVGDWKGPATILFVILLGTALVTAMVRRRTLWIVGSRFDQAAMIVLTVGLFLITAKKSLAMYYPMVAPLMILLAARARRPRFAFGLLILQAAASLPAPQIWSQLLGRPVQIGDLLFASGSAGAAWALLILDLVTVGVTCWFVILAWGMLGAGERDTGR